MPRSNKVVAAVLGGLAAVGLAAALILSAKRGAPSDLLGVRLGDSLTMSRDRFRAPGAGEWTSSAGIDPSLSWAPASSASPVGSARFEFHDGMLVAARFELLPSVDGAAGPELEISRSAVVAREPSGERTRVTMLSRSCPEHADEVKRLLSKRLFVRSCACVPAMRRCAKFSRFLRAKFALVVLRAPL